jgi:hypothetical protein
MNDLSSHILHILINLCQINQWVLTSDPLLHPFCRSLGNIYNFLFVKDGVPHVPIEDCLLVFRGALLVKINCCKQIDWFVFSAHKHEVRCFEGAE